MGTLFEPLYSTKRFLDLSIVPVSCCTLTKAVMHLFLLAFVPKIDPLGLFSVCFLLVTSPLDFKCTFYCTLLETHYWCYKMSSPFWGPMVPLFWIPRDILPYWLFYGGECNVHSLRSTFGAKHADLLVAGSTASQFPTCISRFEWAITQTEEERSTIVPATRLK